MSIIGFSFSLLLFGLPVVVVAQAEAPEKITVCQLKNDPSRYHHKLIELTGFISHGFEDFGLFDPECSSKNGVWLEYGGTIASGIIYCCGVTAARTRPKEIVVEDIPIPLVDDAHFREFDKLIQRKGDSIVHASIVGRFFAGDGYGHMGVFSLLVIQKVLSVDPHNRNDLDYGGSADQPKINKAGCGYSDLVSDEPFGDLIDAQRKAEGGERSWAFDDSRQVAAETLARVLKVDKKSFAGMSQTRQRQGRVVYQWKPQQRNKNYMIVVSRPYLLSFYAQDAKRVAWVVVAAYESFCGSDR